MKSEKNLLCKKCGRGYYCPKCGAFTLGPKLEVKKARKSLKEKKTKYRRSKPSLIDDLKQTIKNWVYKKLQIFKGFFF